MRNLQHEMSSADMFFAMCLLSSDVLSPSCFGCFGKDQMVILGEVRRFFPNCAYMRLKRNHNNRNKVTTALGALVDLFLADDGYNFSLSTVHWSATATCSVCKKKLT